jgi:hypothetical protein
MRKTIGVYHFDLPIALEISSRTLRQRLVCLHCNDSAVFTHHLGHDGRIVSCATTHVVYGFAILEIQSVDK